MKGTLRGAALRALAVYSDEATPRLVLGQYSSFTDEEKADAVGTLASRPAYALALLDAIDKGQVLRNDVSAFTVRQMQALKDKAVTERLTKVWGVVRRTSTDKSEQMSKYKALLTPAHLTEADRSRGRLLFQQTCASCHVLFGQGGQVGPELTGSQRMNLDYLLENILDPSALVPREYQVTVLVLKAIVPLIRIQPASRVGAPRISFGSSPSAFSAVFRKMPLMSVRNGSSQHRKV